MPWRFFAPWRPAAPRGRADDACPACRVEVVAARRVLTEIGAPAAAGTRAVLPGEVVCCVPHTLLGGDLIPCLLAAQAVQLTRLVVDLEEAIRKHDYRFRYEPWGAAYDAPRRAVAHIAGARGLALLEGQL